MAGVLAVVTALHYRNHRPSMRVKTWGCGFAKPGTRMAYTGGSYAQLAQDELYCACLRPSGALGHDMALFPVKKHLRLQIGDLILDRWFLPLFVHFAEVASSFRRLQAGRMNIYLSYMFLTTILLLCWNYFLV
jgi:hydrogenase-4 component B